MPLVTIGVLSYNYSNYVLAALDSLINQTYSNIELIIVDDNSTEKTPQLIDAWIIQNNVNCTFIKNKKNLGITKVSNNIVTLAKGKYISLFAIDDIMLPRKIEEQVKVLEEAGDEYGVCYANVEKMTEDGTPLGPYIEENKFRVIEGNVLKAYAMGQLSFCTPGCLIRTSTYKKTGLYDERVLYEDYNFWLRAFACVKVKYCAYPSLVYRWKETSPIYEVWSKNNNERYNRDRVLSNHQALKFIKDKEVKQFLKKKNRQYLKSLSVHKSVYVKPLVYFLISKGYINIPLRVIVRLITGK
jgi:glycosyltransferase involved in cell wall biosynthesis